MSEDTTETTEAAEQPATRPLPKVPPPITVREIAPGVQVIDLLPPNPSPPFKVNDAAAYLYVLHGFVELVGPSGKPRPVPPRSPVVKLDPGEWTIRALVSDPRFPLIGQMATVLLVERDDGADQ